MTIGQHLRMVTLALALAAPAAAQTVVPLNHLPALAGDYFPLRSAANKHLYHIYVRLPEGYAQRPDERFPIVYLLDGDSTFPMLAPQHLFMTYDDKLPEAILVGIAYGSFSKPTNRRHIDFMPPATGVPAAEAGADQFLAFLERELLPRVEGKFRADPARRILVGQSRGGAMVLYSAFARPDLFWGRIASNASFLPGREIFHGQPAPANRRDLRLAVVGGTREDADRRQAAQQWFAHWQGRAAPWAIKRIEIEGGTHAADLPNAYRRAMSWLFTTP
jgi:uncharacterized protein